MRLYYADHYRQELAAGRAHLVQAPGRPGWWTLRRVEGGIFLRTIGPRDYRQLTAPGEAEGARGGGGEPDNE